MAGKRHKAEKTSHHISLFLYSFLTLCLCALVTLPLHRGAKAERTFSPAGKHFPFISAAGKEATMNRDLQEKEQGL